MTVPTLTPVIAPSALPSTLQSVLAANFPKGGVAACLQEELGKAQQAGRITDTDVDNYVRNVVTDAMRNELVRLQEAGTCATT